VLQAKKEGRHGIDQITKEDMHFTHLYDIAKDRTEPHYFDSEKPSITSTVTDRWQGFARHSGGKVQ
jgi:hypothetical protein